MAYSSIVKPSDYFNTKLYTGNSGTQSITGVNFQPDFLWIKRRTLAGDHNLVDVIRTSDKTLISNSTGAEYSNSTITSFDSDGFSLSGSDGALNASGSNYVSWNWLGGGTASSNTDGSITSSVSANTTAGFSIVSYTGTGANATVGHGLGSTPKIVILKDRDNVTSWPVGGDAIGTTDNNYLLLNQTAALDSASTGFQSFSTTTVGLGSDTWFNGNNRNYIMYCFAEKTGYSKFGSYTGNGSTDGTFVYTSFAPAYILWKNITDAGTNWVVFANKRDTYNPNDDALYPNASTAEEEVYYVDFLSNGFKFRNYPSENNKGTKNYIYMAFAEQPYEFATAR